MYERRDFFADGEWLPSTGSTVLEVVNPTTEETFGSVMESSKADVDRAVTSADRALRLGPWPSMSLEERCEIIRRIRAGILARKDEIAYLGTSTLGQPGDRARGLGGTPGIIDMFLDAVQFIEFERVREEPSGTTLVTRQPVGVVAAITPWNQPLRTEVKMSVPALLSGCTVVLKSSPEVPFLGPIFIDIATEAGLPPGVVNLVFGGATVGDALVRHPVVRKVDFTGNSATGAIIGAHCGEMFKRMQLELGGKSAAIVLEDADLGPALKALNEGNFRGSGQICTGLTRVLAPRIRYDEIVDGLVQQAQAHVVGDPSDDKTTLGPLVTDRHRQRVLGYIEKGREEGALVATGGGRPDYLAKGWFVEPTVLANVDNSMVVARDEIFGPVVCVIPYDTEQQAIDIANDTPYGLHGAVFSADADRALRVARKMATGTVGINCFGTTIGAPFGGVKKSGIGRERGREGFDTFLDYITYTLSLGGSKKG
jgi:acyl-CoA reductase-like NAD-dependent aldehyde dehydrogenase